MRSHLYVMLKLARTLGINKILDGFAGITQEVVSGSDVYYSLNEFDEYKLETPTLSDYPNSIAVLFFVVVTKDTYHKILKAVSSSPYFIYYNSDPELNKDYFGDGDKMFLKFINDNPDDPLSKLFRSRCICIITGFHFMLSQLSIFDKPIIYIPQIINPNYPRFHSEKFYDGWMINNSPAHKVIADKLSEEGIKLLVLTHNKDWVTSQDCIECNKSGLSLDILLSAVSMCKYYVGSYPLAEDNDDTMSKRYSTWNHTSKVLESYYANTYWISSNHNYRQVLEILKSDQWTRQNEFNRYVEINYSFSTYKYQFNDLVDVCRQSIK